MYSSIQQEDKMRTCKKCKRRGSCNAICPPVERLLPKDETGKDAHREINMDPEAFMAAADRYSHAAWDSTEAKSKCPMPDLSKLSSKERRAVLLIMSGLTQRDAAARMRISRFTLRTLIGRALDKLRVAQGSHLIEGNNKPISRMMNGGSR